MSSEVSAAAPDDAVLFWAERAAAYYWIPFAVGAFAILPLMPLDPIMAGGGMGLAALVCAWSRRSFIFRLCPTHLAVRGAPLDPIYKMAWDDIRSAESSPAARQWLGRAMGEVRVILIDDTRVRIPGVRDAELASEAINTILAHRAAARATSMRASAA